MILPDTSIWIDHIRRENPVLSALLERRSILGHPFVLGEVACGSMSRRSLVLSMLALLPPAIPALDSDVLALIDRERLFGTGIGYVDAHLLASALLTSEARLWTRDRSLAAAATQMGVGFSPDQTRFTS